MLDGPLERQSIPHYLISYELLLLGFLIKGVVKYDELQDSQSLNFLLSAIRNACLGSLIGIGKALKVGYSQPQLAPHLVMCSERTRRKFLIFLEDTLNS